FADGYNSRDTPAWRTVWDSNTGKDPANPESTLSQGVGTPALYRPREIDLLNSGNFSSGDQVLIRFRLHADQLTRGWGWAIDNLQIQTPKVIPVTALPEPIFETTQVSLYPNPSSTGEFMLEGKFSENAGKTTVSVQNLAGLRVFSQPLDRVHSTFSGRLDLSRLAAGVYVVNVDTEEGRITKRVVIAK
ncbi:MAG: T9SS type A sorting domain-containing protein, partial [Sphingobacteriaceae bacterium]|nr:T9SS type A sorting domain-containing protein [Cytophagaceae bacterium]